MKLVINTTGQFHLTSTLITALLERGVPKMDAAGYHHFQRGVWFYRALGEEKFAAPYFHNHRDDPDLIAVVEQLFPRSDERFYTLRVVEVPDDIKPAIVYTGEGERVFDARHSWPQHD